MRGLSLLFPVALFAQLNTESYWQMAAAQKLTAQCLELARVLGFDEPAKFGGQRDLIGLWKLGM